MTLNSGQNNEQGEEVEFAAAEPGRRVAVLVGNGKYNDPGIPALTGPPKDVVGLQKVLGDAERGQFDVRFGAVARGQFPRRHGAPARVHGRPRRRVAPGDAYRGPKRCRSRTTARAGSARHGDRPEESVGRQRTNGHATADT